MIIATSPPDPATNLAAVRASSADVSIVVLRPGTRTPTACARSRLPNISINDDRSGSNARIWRGRAAGVRRVGDVTQQPFIERYSAKGVPVVGDDRRRPHCGSACSVAHSRSASSAGPSVGEMAIRSLSSRGRSSTSRSRRIALAMFSLLAATRVAQGTPSVLPACSGVPDQPPSLGRGHGGEPAAISL